MKVTIKKSDLLPVLSKVQGLTGRRTNLAITTNVLVKTNKDGISVSATDLETGFEGFYEAKVESEGIIAINARKFYEIVRDFPSEDIFFNEVENHWIEIGNQKVEYHIVGLNPDDFPEIPKIEDVEFFEIDSAFFAKSSATSLSSSGSSMGFSNTISAWASVARAPGCSPQPVMAMTGIPGYFFLMIEMTPTPLI